jgi:flagellar motor protein MotB
VHGESANWSHVLHADADGRYRLEIVDEDGVTFPVARDVTQGQAEQLIARIAQESRETRKPVKVVIRDPYFMAATVITLKRQPI